MIWDRVRMKVDWGSAALAAALLGLVVLVPWALSTFILAEPVLPIGLVLVFFAGLFPLHARTVFGLVHRSGRPWRSHPSWQEARGPELLSVIPARVKALGVGVFFACWAFAMTALWALRNGGPDALHGHYYANSHGARTPVSEGEYHHL